METEKEEIIIFGQGQLGTFYDNYYNKKGYNIVKPDVDIRNYGAVFETIKSNKPNLVINCAGKTDIDWCEINKTECFEVNTLGADNIAKACQINKVYLIHISSGCIQESKSVEDAHVETDTPNPLCYYAWTKVWAENLIADRADRQGLKVLILRPRQLLSTMVSPRNALTKMLTYSKFIDNPNSCTIVEDLIYATEKLIKKNAVGVYNITNPGITSPYKIAILLRDIIKPDMKIEKISKEELNKMTRAIRIDAILNTKKLESLGIKLKDVNERLVETIQELKKNLLIDTQNILQKTQEETKAKLI